MIIDENTIFYHGSYKIVDEPDLSQRKKGKDFGQGLYLTTSKTQAVKFVKSAIKKAVLDGLIPKNTKVGYVSQYKVKTVEGLKIFEFKNVDMEWLHCVVGHRKKESLPGIITKYRNYDVICGKIANDDTNLVITAYIEGLYGEIGSGKADEMAISFLEPDNLKDQVCYRTQKALDSLEFVESESVMI